MKVLAGLHDATSGSVVLAGAGQMGGAMLAAWLDAGLPVERLSVVEPHPSTDLVERLRASGVRLNPLVEPAVGTVVLAIKPQMLAEAASVLAPLAGEATTLVSVLAGKTLADLRHAFPQAGGVVRAMPNTPAAVRRGITGLVAEPRIPAERRATVQGLFEAVGAVEWLRDEAMIDAVTAVSGSGPAYVFYLVECLAEAGVAAGLEPAAAARLARATVEGAGALMALQPDTPPDVLRRNVTSPGGTTAAALDVLTADEGLRPLMRAAVARAKRRAGELSG